MTPGSFAAVIIACIGERPSTHPKPRVRLTNPPQFLCGWCGKWSPAEEVGLSTVTGNNWPIHPACLEAWYDGAPRPELGVTPARADAGYAG